MKHLRTAVGHGATRPEASSPGAVKARVPYWDNVKLVLIFFVVLGHFLYSRTDLRSVRLLTLGIYTFHMPAFALVSGYLSKSWTRENLGAKLPQLARLVVAYLVFNGVFVLYAAYVGSDVLITVPYYSFWYLIALCVWRLTVGYVAGFGRAGLILSVLAALGIGFWADAGNVFAFGRTIAFYPFFLGGFLMPPDWGERLAAMRGGRKALLGLVLTVAALAAISASYLALRYDYGHVLMDPYARLHDLVLRVAILGVACLATLAILVVTPNVRIPLLTTIGANSLTVYILHRFFVLIFERAYAPSATGMGLIAGSLLGSLSLLVLLGNPLVAGLMDGFLDRGSSLFTRAPSKGFLGLCSKALLVLMALAVAVAPVYAMRRASTQEAAAADVRYQRLSASEEASIDDSYTILFSGDLILLEDQVRRGYTGDGYDFSEMFEYTKPYIEAADLAIGVFEGPAAGEGVGYSNGNFSDDKVMWVNFPDQFAFDIKDAGFDVVTTANNHLLDRGVEGAMRTLDVLDEAGLAHTGSYRSAAEKEAGRVQLVEEGDMRIALLSYTYGVNLGDVADYPDETFIDGELAYLTSTIVDPASAQFAAAKANVEADFARARELGADLIVVLPHWGTQFSFAPDELQEVWREVFLANGADVILGDHTHSVQPIVLEERDGRQTFTCYCPGNYANVYRDHDGDASALVEVYVDRKTKGVIGGSVIPLWTASALGGNYRALPVYDVLTNADLAGQVSTSDLVRVGEVQELVTSVMIGEGLDLQMARPRQVITASGFRRGSVAQLPITDAMRQGTLYAQLATATDVCFVGDSVTEGTRNGGFGWYEPIESLVSGEVTNVSEGGATVQTLLGMTDAMVEADADLYVVAVGTNDVRYRDEEVCAMTADEYVARLGKLVEAIRAGVPDARFAFIAPWPSTDGDANSLLAYDEKVAMNDEYTSALERWCADEGFSFVNANPAIEEAIGHHLQSDYLVDFIHPNSTAGIELYATAVMER